MYSPAVEIFDSHGFRPFAPKKKGDVGYDLIVTIEPANQTLVDRVLSRFYGCPVIVIWPFVGSRSIPSGIKLVMSNDVWCEILARSSTLRKKLMVLGGTIDSGYRGEFFTILQNFGFIPRVIKEGERYAQVVFHYAIRPRARYIDAREFQVIVIQEAEEGGRVATGFGSTGQ